MMKVIYSLQEFRDAVLKIADIAGKTYTACRVCVDHSGRVTFDAYVDGFSWHTGYSMEECLKLLMDQVRPEQTNKEIDVTLEVEKKPEEPELITETTVPDDLPF